jgi:Tfp pilus assembly protein PilF
MSQIPSSSERSANIFINYRREDSAGHTGRLFDRLGARLPGRVFMDIDNLEPGVDFVEVIEKAVGSCQVLIVVMGHEWLGVKDAAGRRRLEDPADFVRLELATALQRNIRVIPVLVQGAPMPRAEELPADLAKLARRNAIELSDGRWAYDVDRLIHTIEEVLQGLDLRAPAVVESHPAAAAESPPAAVAESHPAAPAATAASAARPIAWMAVLAAVAVCGLASAGWKVMKQQAAHSVAVPASTAPTPVHRAPATLAPAAAPVPSAPTPALRVPATLAPAGPAPAAAPVPAVPAAAIPAPTGRAAAVPAPAGRVAAAQASTTQAPTPTAKAPARAAPAPAAPAPAAPASAARVPAAPVPAAPAVAAPAVATPAVAVPAPAARPSAGPTAAVPDAAMAAPGGQARSARAYEASGLKYLQEARYDEAITALTSAINLSRNALGSDPLDALYARSMAYSRSGRASDAISDLESLVKARDDAHYREELAIAYAQVGKREAAIEQYRVLLRPHPDDAWFNVQVGFLYIQSRDYRKAAQAYEKALANGKQLTGTTLIAEAYDNLGISYFHLCWREEAVAAFKKATELNPDFATGLANAQLLRCQRQ